MKIVVGGQIDKKELANMVESLGGDKVEVDVKSDLDAAMAVKNGVADYYLGACNTGGGGALGMAIALLGRDNTSTLSMPGSLKSETDIRHEVSSGKKAFGFTAQHMDKVVPIIMDELLK